MSKHIIDTMAYDLCVHSFQNESLKEYRTRVIYSAMASWIKAISLDHPIYSCDTGVSRRYVYERSKVIFETVFKLYPELRNWFIPTEEKEHPVILVRTRLLKHGDLLNAGFNTNVVLSHMHSKQTSSEFETVYGSVFGNDVEYAGLSTVRRKKSIISPDFILEPQDWLDSFLKKSAWISETLSFSGLEYFDPYSKQSNNHLSWINIPPKSVNGVYLSRIALNSNNYEYYLIKPKEKLCHKLDSFLIKQGYHIRIMCALRVVVNNMSVVTVSDYDTHIILKLAHSLPADINNLLESYAWPYRNIRDNYCWIMTSMIWKYIEPYIKTAGIKITEVTKHG